MLLYCKMVKQSRYRPKWPRGIEEVTVPTFHENGTGWWSVCQPYAPAAFAPKKYICYSFPSEAESTRGP